MRIAFVLVINVLCLVRAGWCVDAISDLRKSSRAFKYEPPSSESLVNAQRIFVILLSGGNDLSEAIKLCVQEGLELLVVRQSEGEFLILMESEGQGKGRGFYAFRRGAPRAFAIQAPHSFSDLQTGEIAARLFLESKAVAVAWNNTSRNVGQADGSTNTDLAHIKRSYLQAFTKAFGETFKNGVILQLHGYNKDRRSSPEGYLSDVIVSNGTREPGRVVRRLVICLSSDKLRKISLYPHDVQELGGTTNAQGRLLRRLHFAGFIHIELSPEVRRRLSTDSAYRQFFLRCIGEAER